MRIAIIGGAGYIGSHVALEFPDDDILIYDDLSSGCKGNVTREFMEANILDYEELLKALKGCDAVIHLAAMAGVRPSIEQPGYYDAV